MMVGVVWLSAPPCGYWLEASTSLRHGRIQQVLSVACPPRPVDSRLRGNDGGFCKGLHQGRGGLVVGLSCLWILP